MRLIHVTNFNINRTGEILAKPSIHRRRLFVDKKHDEVIIPLHRKVDDEIVGFLKEIDFYSNARLQVKEKENRKSMKQLKQRFSDVVAMAG